MLAAYVDSIQNAPSSAQEGTAEFNRQGTSGPWMSLDMLDLAREMTLSMVPFAQWDERIEAESVPAVTGIAPCDVMLDAQIGFLQKSHPDHEGLLLRSEVESNVTRLGPTLAAAHCRAFHDQNRALWEGAPSAASD